MQNQALDYLEQNGLFPLLDQLVLALCESKPTDAVAFAVRWLEDQAAEFASAGSAPNSPMSPVDAGPLFPSVSIQLPPAVLLNHNGLKLVASLPGGPQVSRVITDLKAAACATSLAVAALPKDLQRQLPIERKPLYPLDDCYADDPVSPLHHLPPSVVTHSPLKEETSAINDKGTTDQSSVMQPTSNADVPVSSLLPDSSAVSRPSSVSDQTPQYVPLPMTSINPDQGSLGAHTAPQDAPFIVPVQPTSSSDNRDQASSSAAPTDMQATSSASASPGLPPLNPHHRMPATIPCPRGPEANESPSEDQNGNIDRLMRTSSCPPLGPRASRQESMLKRQTSQQIALRKGSSRSFSLSPPRGQRLRPEVMTAIKAACCARTLAVAALPKERQKKLTMVPPPMYVPNEFPDDMTALSRRQSIATHMSAMLSSSHPFPASASASVGGIRPSPSGHVDVAKIQEICAMGFDEVQVEQALLQCSNNASRAIALLLDEGAHEVMLETEVASTSPSNRSRANTPIFTPGGRLSRCTLSREASTTSSRMARRLDEAKAQELCAMGFHETQVEEALLECDNDCSQAVACLLAREDTHHEPSDVPHHEPTDAHSGPAVHVFAQSPNLGKSRTFSCPGRLAESSKAPETKLPPEYVSIGNVPPPPPPQPVLRSVQVLVLFYSSFGHIARLAAAVAGGCAAKDVDVRVRRIPELVDAGVLSTTKADKAQAEFTFIPAVQPQELCDYHGIIFGFPTRFGTVPFQVQHFLETAQAECPAGFLAGKVGAMFTSSGTQHGGQESTLLNFQKCLLEQGMIVVGMPPTCLQAMPETEVHGCGPYGASTITAPSGKRWSSKAEISAAWCQGRFAAAVTKALFLTT